MIAPCSNCRKRNLCKALCLKADKYVNQDQVSQKEVTIGIPIFGLGVEPINDAPTLSLREKQIFLLWAGGLKKEEICQGLGIKRENLKKQLQNIRKKIPTTR